MAGRVRLCRVIDAARHRRVVQRRDHADLRDRSSGRIGCCPAHRNPVDEHSVDRAEVDRCRRHRQQIGRAVTRFVVPPLLEEIAAVWWEEADPIGACGYIKGVPAVGAGGRAVEAASEVRLGHHTYICDAYCRISRVRHATADSGCGTSRKLSINARLIRIGQERRRGVKARLVVPPLAEVARARW